MSIYTINYCPNPSFEEDIEGCLEINGAACYQDNTYAFHGSYSCHVACPGTKPGEGCYFPYGVVDTPGGCCISFYIYGTAGQTLNVEAIINGDQVYAILPITLVNGWQRVEVDQIPCVTGDELTIGCCTPVTLACDFWVDCCQFECQPGPCHPYCDGDQLGCNWYGPHHHSKSYCDWEFITQASGTMEAVGNFVPVIEAGYVSVAEVIKGVMYSLGALIYPNEVPPVGAFDDFGIFELTDLDPAQTYVSWNNSGLNSGTGTSYTRPYSTFYAPLDYPVSNGDLLWKRADKAAVGFAYSNVAAGASEDISLAQFELLPVESSPPSPSDYDQPRCIHTIVKPDRLNFCTNPSIEVSTAGWVPVGTAVLTQDNTVSVGDIIEYDDYQFTAGTYSLNVQLNDSGDGAQISIPEIIFGNIYTASFYLYLGPGISNVLVNCSGSTVQLADIGGTGYGTGEDFGDGTYGGVMPSSTDLASGVWTRPSVSFTAQASTVTLEVTMIPGTDVVFPANFWIDAVLIEIGENVGTYFDGSFGTNYLWENNGTPGLTRSYYYDEYYIKQQAVSNALAKHVPLGITYTPPQYAVPYTQ